VKPQVWTTFSGDRRYFIGGSDARIIMGNDEDALLRLRFSSMPLSAGRGQARPGVAWLFASFFLLLCVLLWAWG
jgi:hypothetical protein